jgi:hypothetical protein
MKYTYLLLIFTLFFSSCEEEIIETTISSSFTCIVDGDNFDDNTPVIDINLSDMMSINLSDANYDVNFRIYNFSDILVNEIVYFSVPGMGMVNEGTSTYSNTYSPPYDGELVFTTKDADKISGTFHFKSQNVDPLLFTKINVQDGVFTNVSY